MILAWSYVLRRTKELVEEFTRELWVRSDPFLVLLVFDNAVHVLNVGRVYKGNLDKGRMNTGHNVGRVYKIKKMIIYQINNNAEPYR